jgi:hypothetical protein
MSQQFARLLPLVCRSHAAFQFFAASFTLIQVRRQFALLLFAEFAAHEGIKSIGIACLLHVHSRTSSSCSIDCSGL